MSSNFLEQGSHLAERICAFWHTGSHKLKMATDKPELSHISDGSCDNSNGYTHVFEDEELKYSNTNTAMLAEVRNLIWRPKNRKYLDTDLCRKIEIAYSSRTV